jgi:hypothetical protein
MINRSQPGPQQAIFSCSTLLLGGDAAYAAANEATGVP